MGAFKKLTMVFGSSVSPNGWSESWYIREPLTAGENLTQIAKNIAQARNQLCGIGCGVVGLRISQPGQRGAVQPIPFQDQRGDPNKGGLLPVTDVHWGWNCSVRGSVVNGTEFQGYYRRNFCLRGFPDAAMNGDAAQQNWDMFNPYFKFFDAFRKLAIQYLYLKAKDKATAATKISSASVGIARTSLIFTTVAGHGLSTGDEIHIYGLRYTWKPYNGNYVVFKIDNNNFSVDVTTAPSGLWLPGATFRKKVILYSNVTTFQYTRPVHHATGRPTTGSRGRYKTRTLAI